MEFGICVLTDDFSIQRLAFVTNGIALRMLEAGASGSEGRGSTFDEVTVRNAYAMTQSSHWLTVILDHSILSSTKCTSGLSTLISCSSF
jgi:hypothetical protein